MIALGLLLVATAVAARLAVEAAARASVRSRVAPSAVRRSRPRLVHAALARAGRPHRTRQLDAALPHALDAIARSLRSGASLRQSLEETAGVTGGMLGDDLRVLTRELAVGLSVDDALVRWAERRPRPGVRLVAAALALGAETGGATARAVDGVASTLRMNLAIQGEVRALSAQARLSALVIVLAPIGFSLFAATADARTAAFLFRSPAGALCLAIGLGLDAAGWLWMRRLTVIRV